MGNTGKAGHCMQSIHLEPGCIHEDKDGGHKLLNINISNSKPAEPATRTVRKRYWM